MDQRTGLHNGSSQLLVLAYHRIASEGPAALQQWRLTAGRLDEQIGYLKAIGAHATTVKDWFSHFGRSETQTIKRSFAITFDDAFLDFATAAWPILGKYGFGAEVFVPTGYVGGTAAWDLGHGPPAPLLTWSQIKQLSLEGVSFGSHGCWHKSFDSLDCSTLKGELRDSRVRLEDELGTKIDTLAYPHGVHTTKVRRLTAELGYSFGLTVELGACTADSDRFQLPRFEIDGTLPFEAFKNQVDLFQNV
jgi:peptidoglycan/xylan/chitin deacetylase (PgdA/CDA1 family)